MARKDVAPTIKQAFFISGQGFWYYNLKAFTPPGPREWSPSGVDMPAVDVALGKLWEEVYAVTEGLENVYVFAKRERGKREGFVALSRDILFPKDIDQQTRKHWQTCVRNFNKHVPFDITLRQFSLLTFGIEVPVKSVEEALFALDAIEALIQECGEGQGVD